MNKRIRFILIIAYFGVMLTYCWTGLYLGVARLGSSDGWQSGNEFRIVSVDPQGPAKELKPGDQVISINGVRLSDNPRLRGFSNRVPPGTHYTITVQRAGQELTFALQTRPQSSTAIPLDKVGSATVLGDGPFRFSAQTGRPAGQLVGADAGQLFERDSATVFLALSRCQSG
jgi:hypothetical protein